MNNQTMTQQTIGDALTEPRPTDALAHDELAQVSGGVQKIREALTDDDLAQVSAASGGRTVTVIIAT
jgi:hypothetical protein